MRIESDDRRRNIYFDYILKDTPEKSYAHIHAQADEAPDGRKIYSNIGIVLQDYSAGTGDSTVRVTANISPDEAQYIHSRAQACVEKFEFAASKIFGGIGPCRDMIIECYEKLGIDEKQVRVTSQWDKPKIVDLRPVYQSDLYK